MSFSFGIRSLFSLQDDIQSEIIKEVQNAKGEILIAIYAFHLPPLTDLLIQKYKAGITIRCILDFSQSRGNTEKPEVEKLLKADWFISFFNDLRGWILKNEPQDQLK